MNKSYTLYKLSTVYMYTLAPAASSPSGLVCLTVLVPLPSLKLECDKLASEKSEMQRHYIMVSPVGDMWPLI